MPVGPCEENGRSGWRCGGAGKCYTHDGSPAGSKAAKKKAIKQCIAMGEEPAARKVVLTNWGRKVLVGYSEDQPRDDHGRWTGDGGGGGSSAQAAPDYSKMSRGQIENTLSARYPNTEFNFSGRDKAYTFMDGLGDPAPLNVEQTRQIAAQYTRAADAYPDVAQRIDFVGSMQMDQGYIAATKSESFGAEMMFNVNELEGASYADKIDFAMKNDWFNASYKNNPDGFLGATTLHEFGHAVESTRMPVLYWSQTWDSLDAATGINRFGDLSGYGSTSPKEAFAETFQNLMDGVNNDTTQGLQAALDKAAPPKATVNAAGGIRIRTLLGYSEDQPRDDHGRWTDGGGGGAAGTAQLEKLQNQWASLDRQLLPYAGNPNDPNARSIVQKQIDVTRQIHELNIDRGGPAGVGQPGGPRDVVIVGAGPAGLSAALYGGTEGLDTLLVEAKNEVGGQAALSSRIENVMGFPVGTTGDQLAESALTQAERTGADIQLGTTVTGMSFDPETGMKTLTLSDGTTVDTRSVVIAGGVQFRTSDLPGADATNVVYGDSGLLKEHVGDGHAIIVGGANSAGQAAVDVAGSNAQSVSLLVRGESVNAGMSSYLVNQLQSDPKVDILTNTTIASINKDASGRAVSATLSDGRTVPCDGVMFAIGSAPQTDWATGVDRTPSGSIITKPGSLETNVPGVFAAGDVRDGSIHRVITAAADGASAIAQAHTYYPTMPPAPVTGAAGKKPDVATSWLAEVQKLDEQQPFTGFPAPQDHSAIHTPFHPRVKKAGLRIRTLLAYSEDQPRDDHGRWTDAGSGSSNGKVTEGITHTESSPADVVHNDRMMNAITKDVGAEDGMRIEAKRVIGGHEMVWNIDDAGGNFGGIGTYGRVGLDPQGGRWYGETNHGREYVAGPREGVSAVMNKSGASFSVRVEGRTRTAAAGGQKYVDPIAAVQKASERALRLESDYRAAVRAALEELGDAAGDAFEKQATALLTADGRPPSQAMVALYPRPEEATAIAIPGGEPPEKLHCTLAIMNGGGDIDQSALRKCVQEVAANQSPLAGTVGGVGVFVKGEKGHPQIALPDVKGITDLHGALVKALDKAGFKISNSHAFNPHITLGYSPNPEPLGRDKIGLPLHFDHLSFDHNGQSHRVPFSAVRAAATVAEDDWITSALNDIKRIFQDATRRGGDPMAIIAAVQRLKDIIMHLVNLITVQKAQAADIIDQIAVSPPQDAPTLQQQATSRLETIRAAKEHLATANDLMEANVAPRGEVASKVLMDKLGLPDWAQESIKSVMPGGTEALDAAAKIGEAVGPGDAEQGVRLDRAISQITKQAARGAPVDPLAEAGNISQWASMLPVDELLAQDTVEGTYHTHVNPVREAAVNQFQTGAREDLNLNWKLTNSYIGQVLDRTGLHVTGIADTTRRDLQGILARAYREGLSIPDTADFIRRSMRDIAPARARMIARTEMARLVNGSSLAMMNAVTDATGSTFHKTWLTAPGAEYPRHEDYEGLNGQTVALDGLFDVGEDQLAYPGDPDGDPGETINCRCTLIYGEGPPPETAQGESGVTPDSAQTFEDTTQPTQDLAAQDAAIRSQTLTPGGLPWPPPPTPLPGEQSAFVQKLLKGEPDTQHLYMKQDGKLGEYTPKVQAEHMKAYARDLSVAPPGVPGETPTATFMAGGTASGKSTLLGNLQRDGLMRADIVNINPDLLKEDIPLYNQLIKAGERDAPKFVHEESSDMAKQLQALAIERRSDFVLDGTGGGQDSKFLNKIKAAKEQGYTTHVELADVPVETAIARAEDRALDPNSDSYGRFVDTRVIRQLHQEVSARFAEWKDSPLVDQWRLWGTEGPTKVLVAEKRAGSIRIYDQARYDQFLAKGEGPPITLAERLPPTVEPPLAPAEIPPELVVKGLYPDNVPPLVTDPELTKIQNELHAQFPNTEFQFSSDVFAMSKEQAQLFADEYRKLAAAYPEVANRLTFAGINVGAWSEAEANSGMIAFTMTPIGRIDFNPMMFAAQRDTMFADVMQRSIEKGWYPPSYAGRGTQAILDHEFGHMADAVYGGQLPTGALVQKEFQKSDFAVFSKLGQYAATQPSEAAAEAFAVSMAPKLTTQAERDAAALLKERISAATPQPMPTTAEIVKANADGFGPQGMRLTDTMPGELAAQAHLKMIADAKGANVGVKDWRYSGSEALTLDKGRFFEAQPFPAEYKDAPGTPKQCYTNAWKLALDHPELTYVEGFVQPEGLPFPVGHAWTVDKAGRVVDPTLRDVTRGVYYGVPLNTEFVTRRYIAQNTDTVFNWKARDLFQKGLPADAQEGIPASLGRKEPFMRPPARESLAVMAPPVAPTENGIFSPRFKPKEPTARPVTGPTRAIDFTNMDVARVETALHERYPTTEFRFHGLEAKGMTDETAQRVATTYDRLGRQFPEVAAQIKEVRMDPLDFAEASHAHTIARTFPDTGAISLNPTYWAGHAEGDQLWADIVERGIGQSAWWPRTYLYDPQGMMGATLTHEFGHMVNRTYWPDTWVKGEPMIGKERSLVTKMFGEGWKTQAAGYAATSPYEAFAEGFQMMVANDAVRIPGGLMPYQERWVSGLERALQEKGVSYWKGAEHVTSTRALEQVLPPTPKDAGPLLKPDLSQAGTLPEPAKAVYDYQQQSYRINNNLRAGVPLTPYDQGTVRRLDSVIAYNGELRPTTLNAYRGGPDLGTLGVEPRIGATFTDPGFTSISTRKSVAEGFGWTMYRIKVPPNSPMLSMARAKEYGWGMPTLSEHEWLLPRGTTFEITQIRADGSVDLVAHVPKANLTVGGPPEWEYPKLGPVASLDQRLPASLPEMLPPSAEAFGQQAAATLADKGGFSLAPAGTPPTSKRYVTALGTEHEIVLMPGEVNARQLGAYEAEKQAVVNETPGSFLGGWTDPQTGKVYLDVSTSFADQEQALRFAGAHGQHEIWDSQLNRSVKVPDAYYVDTREVTRPKDWPWADSQERIDQPMSAPPGWRDILNNATDAERKAVQSYAGRGYVELNKALRGEIPMTPELQQQADLIDRLIKRAPRYAEPVTVWRSVGMEHAGLTETQLGDPVAVQKWVEAHYVPGEIIDPGGFQSASFGTDQIVGPSRIPKVVMEIRTDHGIPLDDARLTAGFQEKELLLGSDTRYRILKVVPNVEIVGTEYEGPVTLVQVEAI